MVAFHNSGCPVIMWEVYNHYNYSYTACFWREIISELHIETQQHEYYLKQRLCKFICEGGLIDCTFSKL